MTKMNVGTTLVWMKCWRCFKTKMNVGIINVGTALVWMKCWRSFMTKMNVSPASAQMKYWHDFSANVECCHGFMAKMNVGMVSVWRKCRCGLNASAAWWQKKSASAASLQRQMMVRLHNRCKCKYCFMVKMNVGMTSLQGQMLARLHGKDSWCGYVAKTLEMVALKRQVLVQLNCQDKGQYNFNVKY